MARTLGQRAMFLVAAWAALLVAAPAARAQDAADDFRQNCMSCHTIGGGRLTGPDLKDVEKRQKRDWLLRYVVDPGAMLDSGDAYAAKLLQDARGVRMPNIAGMSKKRAEALLDLIAAESKLEKSHFMGLKIPMRPFTPADIALGREIFNGTRRLAEGGAPCLSCHDMGGTSAFGGGRLGPDLTKVFERYEDRRKLSAWLSAPATPTMQPTFRGHPLQMETEIVPLVAYFEHAARNEQESDSNARLLFLLLGIGGSACVLVLMNRLWIWRFRAVRKPLVRRASWAGRAHGSEEGAIR